jgi:hypothetical protein
MTSSGRACAGKQRKSMTMKHLPIVDVIQRCDTWGEPRADGMGKVYVPVFFDSMADAMAFHVELMMAARGQLPYPARAVSSLATES